MYRLKQWYISDLLYYYCGVTLFTWNNVFFSLKDNFVWYLYNNASCYLVKCRCWNMYFFHCLFSNFLYLYVLPMSLANNTEVFKLFFNPIYFELIEFLRPFMFLIISYNFQSSWIAIESDFTLLGYSFSRRDGWMSFKILQVILANQLLDIKVICTMRYTITKAKHRE